MAPNTVKVKHILVKKHGIAEDLIEQINTGKHFEELAKQFSECPSRKKGGSLGDVARGKMVKEFEKAAFALKKGEMTQIPVKTKFGYHIIKRVK